MTLYHFIDPKPSGSPVATPLPSLATTAITSPPSSDVVSATQLPSNTTPIVMSEVVVKAVIDSLNSDKDDKKDDETTTTSTPGTVSSAGTTAPAPTFPGYSQDYKGEEIAIDSSHQPRALPDQQPKLYPNSYQPKEHNFQVQIETFSSLALCIARTLFDFWCVAQLVASLPFLFGVCLRIRCLFIARLMLDALFLVILFIYT